jgi:hypothetical protein
MITLFHAIRALNKYNFFFFSDTISRAQLINDAMKLAHAGYLEYSIALDISSYLHYELEYIPWLAGFNVFEYLNERLLKTETYDKFKVRNLLATTTPSFQAKFRI